MNWALSCAGATIYTVVVEIEIESNALTLQMRYPTNQLKSTEVGVAIPTRVSATQRNGSGALATQTADGATHLADG